MKHVKFILAGIAMTIIAQIVHGIGASFGMNYYTNPDYFPVWSKIMMPSSGPPPASFFYWSLGLGLISWLLFLYVYSVIKNAVPGAGTLQKGLAYGALVFLVTGFSGSIALFLLINLPLGLIVLWAVEGLIIYLLNGIVAVKFG